MITSPAFIVVKAAEAFAEQTTAPNQLWQTDFTYLEVIESRQRRVYHVSLGNLTPADVNVGRGVAILAEGRRSRNSPSETDA